MGDTKRCTTCSKALDVAPDALGRCSSCHAGDARAVDCECGFLYAFETCSCARPQPCHKCGATDRALDSFFTCTPCTTWNGWRHPDDFTDEQPTLVTSYDPIGREAVRQRASRPTEVAA